jgi:hypothetical protein
VKVLKRTIVAAVLVLACVALAFGEEQLGVVVYPGAKYDEAQTTLLRKALHVRGAAYLTNDDIRSVIAFYRKQGLLFLKIGDSQSELARFKKTDTDVDVVVQKPRKAPHTGAVILIFKKDPKENDPDLQI